MAYLITIVVIFSPQLAKVWVQYDPTDVLNMFPQEDLEIFGAFSLVITALLWFIGYLILQVRSYKRMYLKEVQYNKEMSEAEAERSRIALKTMEKVRETMEAQMKKAGKDRERLRQELREEDSENNGKSKTN